MTAYAYGYTTVDGAPVYPPCPACGEQVEGTRIETQDPEPWIDGPATYYGAAEVVDRLLQPCGCSVTEVSWFSAAHFRVWLG